MNSLTCANVDICNVDVWKFQNVHEFSAITKSDFIWQ